MVPAVVGVVLGSGIVLAPTVAGPLLIVGLSAATLWA
jgi:hypothetical protein